MDDLSEQKANANKFIKAKFSSPRLLISMTILFETLHVDISFTRINFTESEAKQGEN